MNSIIGGIISAPFLLLPVILGCSIAFMVFYGQSKSKNNFNKSHAVIRALILAITFPIGFFGLTGGLLCMLECTPPPNGTYWLVVIVSMIIFGILTKNDSFS
jgi:hypothetical protein